MLDEDYFDTGMNGCYIHVEKNNRLLPYYDDEVTRTELCPVVR